MLSASWVKTMSNYVYGVDVGGTSIKIGRFEAGQEVKLIKKWEIPTRLEDGGQHILEDIAIEIGKDDDNTGERIKGIGLAVPGPVLADGTVNRCINLGWNRFNVEQTLADLVHSKTGMKLKVRAANDANAAALGEYFAGAGRSYSYLLMATLGTGVGGGFVADGQILTGATGAACEIGHLVVNPEEPETCNCGKHGCLEQYVSATGIVRLAKMALSGRTQTALSGDDLTAEKIFEAAKAGDELALGVVDEVAQILGMGLANAANVLNPDVIVLGGGVSKAGEFLRVRVEKSFRLHAFHACQGADINLAELSNDAGIFGAALLIR